MTSGGLIDTIYQWLGGAATTLMGAFMGRAMYHATQQKPIGIEILWELPIAVGLAFIGEAIGSYLELTSTTTTGLIAALAYIGPRGVETLFVKYISRK